MKLQSFFAACLVISIFICLPSFLHAQPGGPGGDPDKVPFDGGLSLLIAAGVGYASKKAIDKRKKEKRIENTGK